MIDENTEKAMFISFPDLVAKVQAELNSINPALVAKPDFYYGEGEGEAQRVVLVDTWAMDKSQVLVGYTEDHLRELIAENRSLVPLDLYWEHLMQSKVGDFVACRLVGTPYSLSRGCKLNKPPRFARFGFVVDGSGKFLLTRSCTVEKGYYREDENVDLVEKAAPFKLKLVKQK